MNFILLPAFRQGCKFLHMRNTIQKPGLKKLFRNKFYTYVVADSNGRGRIVEVELKVTGRRISYLYTDVKERG